MIRKATPEDLDFVYNLYMDPLVNPYLLYEQMDIDSFRPIFLDLLAKDLKYIYEVNAVPAGMFKLIPLTYRTDHIAYLGGLAIHPLSGGRGEGQRMLEQILAFAREQGILRVELSVATINERAIRLYEKMGFEKEGVLRKYTHLKSEKRFLDEVLMAYLF